MKNILIGVQIIKDLAIAFSAMFGVYHGVRALQQWRAEMIGKDKYKIAKELSQIAIALFEELHSARNSFAWTDEHETHYKNKLMDENQIPFANEEFLRFEAKLEVARKYFIELKQVALIAQAFHIDISENLEEAQEILGRLASAAYHVYCVHPNKRDKDNEIFDEMWNIIHGFDKDKLGTRIEEQKDSILVKTKKYLL